jgi:hypothetical protein
MYRIIIPQITNGTFEKPIANLVREAKIREILGLMEKYYILD